MWAAYMVIFLSLVFSSVGAVDYQVYGETVSPSAFAGAAGTDPIERNRCLFQGKKGLLCGPSNLKDNL